ncbi:hypothetical protein EYF80_031209 [Liparis tanakae]|uniref:Uncharacterized protein n=1 Tax=Liparis tanakae TaxID=230148 RepID=A0A4Z2GYQ5_9TELE|nr:hypothetical protein EYF80_031209 [Liparis tanakae]
MLSVSALAARIGLLLCSRRTEDVPEAGGELWASGQPAADVSGEVSGSFVVKLPAFLGTEETAGFVQRDSVHESFVHPGRENKFDESKA